MLAQSKSKVFCTNLIKAKLCNDECFLTQTLTLKLNY